MSREIYFEYSCKFHSYTFIIQAAAGEGDKMPSKTEFQEKLDSSWEEVGTTVGLVGDNLWVSVAVFCLVHILGLPTNNPKSILCGYVC